MTAKRAILILVGCAGLIYIADEIVARVRPRGEINVEVFYSVVRKDNRIDYIRGDPATESCVQSAGPHIGLRPCWYVARHPQKEISVGVPRDDFWRH